jgi:drug/metabolite transporter (DMT)-like permease
VQRIYPLLFVFLWSTGFIGAKYGLPYAEPLSFLFVRYLAVISLMTVIALLTRAPWPKAPMQWFTALATWFVLSSNLILIEH